MLSSNYNKSQLLKRCCAQEYISEAIQMYINIILVPVINFLLFHILLQYTQNKSKQILTQGNIQVIQIQYGEDINSLKKQIYSICQAYQQMQSNLFFKTFLKQNCCGKILKMTLLKQPNILNEFVNNYLSDVIQQQFKSFSKRTYFQDIIFQTQKLQNQKPKIKKEGEQKEVEDKAKNMDFKMIQIKEFYNFLQENNIQTNMKREIEQFDENSKDHLQKTSILLILKSLQNGQIDSGRIIRRGLSCFINLTYLTIEFNFKTMQDEIVSNIGIALQSLVQLKCLSSTWYSEAYRAGLSKFSEGIAHLKKLQELTLIFQDSCNIGPAGAKDLSRGMRDLQNVSKLVLEINEWNNIGNNGLFYLLQGISNMVSLSIFNLKFCQPNNSNPKYEVQNIEEVGFIDDKEKVEDLSFSFKSLQMLQKLDLSLRLTLSDPDLIDVRRVFQGLSNLTNLSDLNIYLNIVKPRWLFELGKTITSFENLIDFQLFIFSVFWGEYIDTEDAIQFGKGLSNLTKLQSLDIVLPKLTEDGAVGVISGIKQLKVLQTLRLSLLQIESKNQGNQEVRIWSGISELKNIRNLMITLDLSNILQICEESCQSLTLSHIEFNIFIKQSNTQPKILLYSVIRQLSLLANLVSVNIKYMSKSSQIMRQFAIKRLKRVVTLNIVQLPF